jgi:hypothetical protein
VVLVRTDVSEGRIVFIIGVKGISALGTTLVVMHQQLQGYKFEKKLQFGVCEENS